jgi:hypothetical protein
MRFQARPTVSPVLASALGLAEADLRPALDELMEALQASEPWQRYVTAAQALSPADEEALTEILLHFRADLGLEAIRAVDEDRPVRRMFHRHAVLRRAETEAAAKGGAIAEYYTSFRRVDRTLNGLVAVLGQLLIHGPFEHIAVRRGSWRRGDDDAFEIAVGTTGILRNLNVLAIDIESEISALKGLAMIEGVNFTATRRGEMWEEEVHLTGVLLPK